MARADVYPGLTSASLRNHQYDAARRWAAKAYDAVAKGARDAGVDVAKAEAKAQAESRATRAESPAHPNGLYVDTEQAPLPTLSPSVAPRPGTAKPLCPAGAHELTVIPRTRQTVQVLSLQGAWRSAKPAH